MRKKHRFYIDIGIHWAVIVCAAFIDILTIIVFGKNVLSKDFITVFAIVNSVFLLLVIMAYTMDVTYLSDNKMYHRKVFKTRVTEIKDISCIVLCQVEIHTVRSSSRAYTTKIESGRKVKEKVRAILFLKNINSSDLKKYEYNTDVEMIRGHRKFVCGHVLYNQELLDQIVGNEDFNGVIIDRVF